MELDIEQKKELIRKLGINNNNINNWAKYEQNTRAWAEEHLRDAPFVEHDDDIFARKDIIL